MAVALLTSDQLDQSAFGPQQWGIFNSDGSPVLAVDSVASIEYARDYRISDYPQEQGAFESYNKVQVPFQAKIGFLINESRFIFLTSVEAAVASLNLVAVITPEISYPNANLTHYGFRRESRNGVTLIRVEVWAEEVRPTGSAQLSQSSTSSASPATSAPASSSGSGSASSSVSGTAGATGTAPTASGTLANAQSPNAASVQQGGVVQATPPQATAVINDGSPAATAAATAAAAAAPASPATSSSGAGATMSYSFIGPIPAPQ